MQGQARVRQKSPKTGARAGERDSKRAGGDDDSDDAGSGGSNVSQVSTEETDLCFCCVIETSFRRRDLEDADDVEAGRKEEFVVVRMVRIGPYTLTFRVFVLSVLAGIGCVLSLLVSLNPKP